MPTYTVTFLSRNEQGRFKREHQTISAADHLEAESWVRHGARHGKWHLEGPITIRGPIATDACETRTVSV